MGISHVIFLTEHQTQVYMFLYDFVRERISAKPALLPGAERSC